MESRGLETLINRTTSAEPCVTTQPQIDGVYKHASGLAEADVTSFPLTPTALRSHRHPLPRLPPLLSAAITRTSPPSRPPRAPPGEGRGQEERGRPAHAPAATTRTSAAARGRCRLPAGRRRFSLGSAPGIVMAAAAAAAAATGGGGERSSTRDRLLAALEDLELLARYRALPLPPLPVPGWDCPRRRRRRGTGGEVRVLGAVREGTGLTSPAPGGETGPARPLFLLSCPAVPRPAPAGQGLVLRGGLGPARGSTALTPVGKHGRCFIPYFQGRRRASICFSFFWLTPAFPVECTHRF